MSAYTLRRELDNLTDWHKPRFLQTIETDGPLVSGVIRIAANTTDRFWERHDGGDEILMILKGEATFTLDDGRGEFPVRAGDMIFMPKGVAHNAKITKDLEVFFITPTEGNVDWEDGA
mgnify:CR=1 FL=1